MTTTRTFGAIHGAGSQVREGQAPAPIQEGPLGYTVMMGAFRSGPVGTYVQTGGKDDQERIYGGLTQDSDAPLAAKHFWATGIGAGVLACIRVTDGTEVAANLALYDRNVELGILERDPNTKLPAQTVTLVAQNGGRWAGRRSVQGGDVTLSTAITGTSTINLGGTHLEDQWTGALIKFPNDDAAFEGVVIGNTTAGLFTISGTWSDDVTNGTDGAWNLELVNEHELTGDPEYLAVEVQDGGESPATEFSLQFVRDEAPVRAYNDKGMSASGSAYWLDALNADKRAYLVTPTDSFSGDAADPLTRPANYADIPAPGGVAGNEVTFQVIRWKNGASNTGDPYLDTVNDIVWGSDPRECTITATMTAATTFTTSIVLADGETIVGPNGTLGTNWVPGVPWIPWLNLRAGGVAAIAGDTIVVYVRPLPANLKDLNGFLYVAASNGQPGSGDVRERYKIRSNDYDTVTLAPSVSLVGKIVAPGAPTVTGATAGTYDMSTTSDTFIYSAGRASDEDGPYTLTSTLSGAAETTTAVVADFNAQELARVSATATDKLIEFTVSSDDKIVATLLQDYGSVASLLIGAGTMNAIGGFTAGSTTGTQPTIARVQWRQQFGGGYDGLAGLDPSVHHLDLWDLSTSPLNDWLEINTGLMHLTMPGVTNAAAQQAMMTWGYTNNGMAYPTIPDTILTEADAIAWYEDNLAIGAAQKYAPVVWPSYVEIASPYAKDTLYTAPAVGLILGFEARFALQSKGYHLAAAGEDALISPIAKDLPTGDRRLDQEQLNKFGLIELRKRGPRIYIYGDRIPAPGGREWKHKRATVSHIGRTLLTNTGRLVFSAINAKTFAEVKSLMIGLFQPWYRIGWFDDPTGSFADAVQIKVDRTNNTADEGNLGNLHSATAYDVINTAERVIHQTGPKGVSETT